MMELVFATHNQNKLQEVQQLLPKHIKLLSLNAINCFDEIPETQPTIKGNAIQKANYVKAQYNFNCFADDTGLEVEALNNQPGVYSARYAGIEKNSEANMDKLLAELQDKSNRSAQFKTVIALVINGKTYTFTGICEGEITTQKQGEKGFGYDPIFKPKGYTQTFAEMPLAIKNKISHRAKAIQQLVEFLEKA